MVMVESCEAGALSLRFKFALGKLRIRETSRNKKGLDIKDYLLATNSM